MSAKYEIKQAKDGKFYFNLKASNGQRHRISEKKWGNNSYR